MTAAKKPARAKVPVGVVPHATPGAPTAAETTGHVPPSPAAFRDEPTRNDLPSTVPPAAIVRGTRVLYTNRLGVGPWPGVVEDAHVISAGVPCCWLLVTKPNGNTFFTAAPMGDGPDAFTLAD